MGRKRRRNKGSGGEGGGARPGKGGPGESWGKEEMRQAASPLIAAHPSGALVAVAFGATVRVYHLALDRLVALASDLDADAAIVSATDQPPGADASAPAPAADPPADPPAWHSDVIRAIRFDPTGRFMLTAGDDKLARVWRVHLDHPAAPAVRCVRRALLPKKLCAACFSDDGEHALFANKFGDVHALATTAPCFTHTPAPGSNPTANDDDALGADAEGAAFLLGHCCSIITDACVLPGTNLVCTSDRDHKVRVSILPKTAPLAEGSHEIQSFCHGHTAFVACVAACVASAEAPGRAGKLVTGGGDGTVRLWNAEDGAMLDAVTLAEPHEGDEGGEGGDEGDEVGGEGGDGDEDGEGEGADEGAAEPAFIAVTRGEAPREATRAPAVFAVAVNASGVVVAAVEGRDEFAAMVISPDGTKLRLEGWRSLPTSMADASPRHFAAYAAEEFDGFWGVAEAEAGAEEGAEEGAEARVFAVDATGAAATEATATAAAALRARGPGGGRGVGDAMRKKVYGEDEREERKRGRRDKTTFSAAAAAYQKDKETVTRQP